MQYFQSAKNPYLKDQYLRQQLPYSFPVEFTANPHGRKGIFDCEKTIDKMAQTYLLVDYTIQPNATADRKLVAPYLGFKTFSDIMFGTRATKVDLMTLKPVYNIWQYERLKGYQIYTALEKGMAVPDDFLTTGRCTLKVPLFMFYSESKDSFMPIRNLEDLQLTFFTASVEDVGMWLYDTTDPEDPVPISLIPLTSLKVSLVQESFNRAESNLAQFENGTDISISKSIKNSYNVFYEDTVLLKAGSTSHSILLRCPFPLPVVVAFIYNQKNRYKINKYSIKVRNSYLDKDVNLETDYSLYDKFSGYQESMYMNRWMNESREILGGDGLITWSAQDNMSPATLDITYDAMDEDYNLYVFCPIITYHEVSSKGEISINDSDEVKSNNKMLVLQNPMSNIKI